MSHELWKAVLGHIQDQYIEEAAAPVKKKTKSRIWGAAAAVLAAVILVFCLFSPSSIRAEAISLAKYPSYRWVSRSEEMSKVTDTLEDYFFESIRQCLSGAEDQNTAFSPVNLYMALAMTAELTDGSSRQQILALLHADDIASVRQQASGVWNACYLNDGDQTVLANSLWLEKELSYNQEIMDTLSQSYYASVYKGDLGSEEINSAISQWLDQQSRGFLKHETASVKLSQETVLALYSTIYYRAMWTENSEFNSSNTLPDVFHAPGGDVTVSFMHKELWESNYYWAEDCGAVCLGLKDGSRMWLILPDEGKTPSDLIESGYYRQLVAGDYNQENSKYLKINLSVPKFDIRASRNLDEDLKAMGITDVFAPETADFSPSVTGSPVFLSGVNQSTRVAIDERGVIAASYIELPGAGAAPPPEEIMDFIVDRPFLFVITNRYDIPLFAGTVCLP